MRNLIESEIYKAVMNVGVNVDKEELVKALQYDREQYQKGYKDRDDQLVRCKDCDYYESWGDEKICARLGEWYGRVPEDWFCADGKRKEG